MKGLRLAILFLLAGLLIGCGGKEGTVPETAPEATPASATVPSSVASPTPTAVPTPEGPQAMVVDVINEVDAHALPEEEWVEAAVDMTIYLGGEVWAQEASTARVGVEKGLVRVAPNTIFTFGQPEPGALELRLDEGQMWVNVEGLAPGETFQVETPSAVASVRGTRFSVRVGPDGSTLVSTWVGTVTVSAARGVVTVSSGLQTTVAPGKQPGAPEPMSPDEQILWGMASGTGLDVALPAAHVSDVVTYTGYSFNNYDWSPAGDYFAFSYYSKALADYVALLYDVAASEVISAPVPAGAAGLFFNPAGDELGFQLVQYPKYYICTVGMDGTPGSCFGGEALYGWPFWSPDGEWIAFYSEMDMPEANGVDLYVAHPDGSDLTRLTFDGIGWYNIRQAWSPQGDRIAFVHTDDYNGPGEVWVINADGTDAQMLFDGIYGEGYDHLAWSPDGTSLAVPAADGGLYIVPVDGAQPWIVPGTEEWYCWSPVWSPTEDGWPLFFYSRGPDDVKGLWYVMDGSGGPSYLAGADWGPVWSPDGDRAAVGFTDYTGDMPTTEIYFLQTCPDFWP